MPPLQDTIFALSSGALPSGVAIIRISGPAARAVLEHLTGQAGPPRRARLCDIRNGSELLDRGLAIYFPGPASFTGEDCAELHLHGGRAVVASVLDALTSREGMRAAEAGEFTRRAFVNGKVDLVEAEALADLVEAETQAQRRLALANSGGIQSALYADWRARLVSLRARIEAELDFSDQEDVPANDIDAVRDGVNQLRQEIDSHLNKAHAAEIVRDGFRVAIVGAPNAGKSTLLNLLAGREAAIVTEHPGTTRDVIEVAMEIKGQKVVLADTAGLRETEDPVERIGIARTLATAASADLVLRLTDLSDPHPVAADIEAPAMLVGTKSDLVSQICGEDAISARTGAGVEALLEAIARRALDAGVPSLEGAPIRVRQVNLLRACARALDAAGATSSQNPELIAEELRRSSDCLGRLTGAIETEEVLGDIFSRFCIGK